MSRKPYRYRLARRPFLDGSGELHPKGAFVISRTPLEGDNFVPVDEDRNDTGLAVDKTGRAHANPSPLTAKPEEEVVPLAEMTDDELRAELERRAATSNPAAAVDVVAASVEPGSDADPLEALTKAELAVKLDERQIAKPDGITDWDKLKKAELIALLKG
jgi:hypothetical protein